MPARIIILLLLATLPLCACQKEQPAEPVTNTEPAKESLKQTPPAPPLFEDFEGDPQLSLFPRAGDFQPEPTDQEKRSYWLTFIDHLVRTSGVLTSDEPEPRHVFALRGIKSIDSVGFFSPLAVEPDTSYKVGFSIRTDLPEDAEAGLGILEFDHFLWLADQFPKSLTDQHQTGVIQGPAFSGKADWQDASFEFRTGPQTGMIHLVLYRDGAHSREPVLFDNIRIEKSE